MRKGFFSLVMILAVTAHAQKNTDEFFLYDKDWNSTNNPKASAFFMQVKKYNDSFYVCRFYSNTGPLIRQESYKDVDLTKPNGPFAWYDAKGMIDSTGEVNNFRKDGEWVYYNDTLGIDLSITYNKGKELERIDFVRKKRITKTGETDYVRNKPDSSGSKPDEREAEFVGGMKAYRKYLEKNINIPERSKNLRVNGAVKISFLISNTGKVNNAFILHSIEYASDAEALRVIETMPNWKPAFQNGKNVTYRAIQTITFQVSEE